jgi:hypothetical protein
MAEELSKFHLIGSTEGTVHHSQKLQETSNQDSKHNTERVY